MIFVHANRHISLAPLDGSTVRELFPGPPAKVVRWKFDSIVQIVR